MRVLNRHEHSRAPRFVKAAQAAARDSVGGEYTVLQLDERVDVAWLGAANPGVGDRSTGDLRWHDQAFDVRSIRPAPLGICGDIRLIRVDAHGQHARDMKGFASGPVPDLVAA